MPMLHSHSEDNWMLSGINSKKEIANITPAANASMLYIKISDGFFRTPINEPITGPAILMRRMMYIGSMLFMIKTIVYKFYSIIDVTNDKSQKYKYSFDCFFIMNPAEHKKSSIPGDLSEEDKHKMHQLSHISLWLDGYDDLFSDFDPRPYSQRTLSDDFLSEAKKFSKERTSGITELKLLIPADQRNTYHEGVIKKRIRKHFKIQYDLLVKERKGMIREGLLFAIIGIILMIITSFMLFNRHPEKSPFLSFLLILFEPASWFLFWEGSRLVIFESKEKKPDLKVYEKMTNYGIHFMSY